MTAPALLPIGPDDVEDAIVAWMSAVRRSAMAWETGDGTPFTLVTLLTGAENAEIGFGDPIVQVDTLCDKALGYANAKAEKKLTHQRMLELCRNLDPVQLNGRVWGADYGIVIEQQQRLPFGIPTIIRYVGRYQFGIPYVPVANYPSE
jgi:hypothetical protein